jgi:hypothetical protein
MGDRMNRPRLKGLDEMPRPRRTLRDHYFSLRAGIAGSEFLRRAWPVLKVASLVLVVLMLAHWMGVPIEKHVHQLLAMLLGLV